MITRLNLSTVSTDISPDMTISHKVQAPDGRHFILMATDVTEDDFPKLDVMSMFFYLAYPHYMKEVSVFPATEDWEIPGECSEECAQGMCSRRIAEDPNSGDIDRAYDLLINYLNA